MISQYLKALEKELEVKAASIEEKNAQLKEKNAEIAELRRQLALQGNEYPFKLSLMPSRNPVMMSTSVSYFSASSFTLPSTEAKADWLYNLPMWDAILTQDKRKELYKAQIRHVSNSAMSIPSFSLDFFSNALGQILF